MSLIQYTVPVSVVYDEEGETGQPVWVASEPWLSNSATGVTPEDALTTFYEHYEEKYQWLLLNEPYLKPQLASELAYLRRSRRIS